MIPKTTTKPLHNIPPFSEKASSSMLKGTTNSKYQKKHEKLSSKFKVLSQKSSNTYKLKKKRQRVEERHVRKIKLTLNRPCHGFRRHLDEEANAEHGRTAVLKKI